MNNTQDAHQRTTVGKALRINLDSQRYGTFAEIGAGQEVARFFFQAGKASQTIAKTISAYDMTFSDSIYGRETNGRYVCESRLHKMLDHEYSLLDERLKKRGENSTFFAFADTVATGSDSKNCHGWMGVRFQTKPLGPTNDIILHVRMHDENRLRQQEALGVLGVNLLTVAFYSFNPYQFIDQLTDGLSQESITIDLIRLQGPDTESIPENELNIELVKKAWSEAIYFNPQFKLSNTSDEIYGKSLLIQRGKYRPVTNTHLDIFKKGHAQLAEELKLANNPSPILPLMEITMTTSHGDTNLDVKDFLQRVEILCSLGHSVLITRFQYLYELKQYLRRSNKNPMALIVGAYHLDKLFEEKNFKSLSGGMLEGLGRLLDEQTKVYIYPHKTDQICVTTKSYFPSAKYNHIYKHFIENKLLQDVSGCDDISSYIHSHEVLELKKQNNSEWEKHVPSLVKEMILKKGFFKAN